MGKKRKNDAMAGFDGFINVQAIWARHRVAGGTTRRWTISQPGITRTRVWVMWSSADC
jgi:hypothetical protein